MGAPRSNLPGLVTLRNEIQDVPTAGRGVACCHENSTPSDLHAEFQWGFCPIGPRARFGRAVNVVDRWVRRLDDRALAHKLSRLIQIRIFCMDCLLQFLSDNVRLSVEVNNPGKPCAVREVGGLHDRPELKTVRAVSKPALRSGPVAQLLLPLQHRQLQDRPHPGAIGFHIKSIHNFVDHQLVLQGRYGHRVSFGGGEEAILEDIIVHNVRARNSHRPGWRPEVIEFIPHHVRLPGHVMRLARMTLQVLRQTLGNLLRAFEIRVHDEGRGEVLEDFRALRHRHVVLPHAGEVERTVERERRT
mmetsp:Transcript_77225/g.236334  ORF Transcript_77225/g.236334 Transcript_77225/m.236334 type:complete len:302 (-) Transcript_77225:807-1712(-)